MEHHGHLVDELLVVLELVLACNVEDPVDEFMEEDLFHRLVMHHRDIQDDQLLGVAALADDSSVLVHGVAQEDLDGVAS